MRKSVVMKALVFLTGAWLGQWREADIPIPIRFGERIRDLALIQMHRFGEACDKPRDLFRTSPV